MHDPAPRQRIKRSFLRHGGFPEKERGRKGSTLAIGMSLLSATTGRSGRSAKSLQNGHSRTRFRVPMWHTCTRRRLIHIIKG